MSRSKKYLETLRIKGRLTEWIVSLDSDQSWTVSDLYNNGPSIRTSLNVLAVSMSLVEELTDEGVIERCGERFRLISE